MQITVRRPCTARSCPTSSTRPGRRRRHGAGRAARSDGGGYDVSLAWTGLRPGRTADAIFALDTAQSTSRSSRPRRATSRCRRRTSSTPTSTATSATRPRARSRSGSPRLPGAPPGYWPAPGWKSRYDWKGFVPFAADAARRYDPPEGVHRRGQPGGQRQPDAVPHHRVGLRLPRPADPRPDRGARPRSTPGADVRRSRWTTATASRRRWSRSCCGSRPTPTPRTPRTCCAHWDFTQPTGRSDQAAAAAYYNAVWPKLLDLTFNDELHRRHQGRRRRPVDAGRGQPAAEEERPVVGQQADARRDRGPRRDPAPGDGRGPATT